MLLTRAICLSAMLGLASGWPDPAAAQSATPSSVLEAVKHGNATATRALLRRAPREVDTRDADGTTALHWAVSHNDLATVDLLLRAGADADTASRYGVTPLALACLNGNAAIIKRLLDAGADVNGEQAGDETALMTASRTGNADAVKVLLDYGADPNAAEATRRQTALMWAANEGNTAAVKILIQSGADIRTTSQGPPALAAKKGAPARGKPRSRIDSFTPLLFAVRAGHIDTALALLEAGASPNETAEDGTNALVIAIVNAHWEMAGMLVDHGADPNAAGQGWTALHQLVRSRNPSIGQMPGPVSTGRLSSLDLAQKLIEHGANVNARMTKDMNNDGYRTRLVWKDCTPLLLAAKASDFEMMRWLAAHGADPRAVNAIHDTALMLASGLAMYHQSEDSGTDEAALEAVKVALELGAGDVNAADDDGDTALHGAAERELPDIAQLLIAHGAKLDATNKHDATAVMVANGYRIINMQRHPKTIALLSQAMRDRNIPVVLWPVGQAHVAESVFENADATSQEDAEEDGQTSARTKDAAKGKE